DAVRQIGPKEGEVGGEPRRARLALLAPLALLTPPALLTLVGPTRPIRPTCQPQAVQRADSPDPKSQIFRVTRGGRKRAWCSRLRDQNWYFPLDRAKKRRAAIRRRCPAAWTAELAWVLQGRERRHGYPR